MPFVSQILKYGSLSIIGVEKNTGKTTCLNYLLRRLANYHKTLGITSIGLDGEETDTVKDIPKPRIRIPAGSYFVTAASFYKQKLFDALIRDTGDNIGMLGPLVIAEALESGYVCLAGPPGTTALKQLIDNLHREFAVDLCLIDGALSRVSFASPAITEAMILCTGASYSSNMNVLVNKTRFLYDLIQLPRAQSLYTEKLKNIRQGIWAFDKNAQLHNLNTVSALAADDLKKELSTDFAAIYVAGAVSDKILKVLSSSPRLAGIELIAKDFSRFFIDPRLFYSFQKKGGRISVCYRSELVAVCINPYSPEGYHLNSSELEHRLEQALAIPVYDIRRLEYAA